MQAQTEELVGSILRSNSDRRSALRHLLLRAEGYLAFRRFERHLRGTSGHERLDLLAASRRPQG